MLMVGPEASVTGPHTSSWKPVAKIAAAAANTDVPRPLSFPDARQLTPPGFVTVTANEAVTVWLWLSDAVQLTVVWPIGNTVPDGGTQETVTGSPAGSEALT